MCLFSLPMLCFDVIVGNVLCLFVGLCVENYLSKTAMRFIALHSLKKRMAARYEHFAKTDVETTLTTYKLCH